jgi:hypothetical protein
MNRSLLYGWGISLGHRVAAGTSIALLAASLASAAPSSVLYSTEGNRLRRYDLDTVGYPRLVEDVLVERASAAETGSSVVGEFRDINGMICQLPDGSGRFIAGEDTGQPTTPPGWGVFTPGGVQVGKLTATFNGDLGNPCGCAFDASGWTSRSRARSSWPCTWATTSRIARGSGARSCAMSAGGSSPRTLQRLQRVRCHSARAAGKKGTWVAAIS